MLLEDKILAFFPQRATLALSHVGHLQDPTDPTSLALDAESHADFLTRLRFSTHVLTDNRVRGFVEKMRGGETFRLPGGLLKTLR